MINIRNIRYRIILEKKELMRKEGEFFQKNIQQEMNKYNYQQGKKERKVNEK